MADLIEVEEFTRYPATFRMIGSDVKVIDEFLTLEECHVLIECASLCGFREARDHLAGRTNSESFIENPALAFRLEAELLNGGLKVGLDDLFEIYRYADGQHITVHADGGRDIRGNCQSNVTLLIYLSDNFQGGRTIFPAIREAVVPIAGRAVLFNHGVLHAAEAVAEGIKYVARINGLLSQ